MRTTTAVAVPGRAGKDRDEIDILRAKAKKVEEIEKNLLKLGDIFTRYETM